MIIPPFFFQKGNDFAPSHTRTKANKQTRHLKLQRLISTSLYIRKHLQIHLNQKMKKTLFVLISFLSFFTFLLYLLPSELCYICIGPNVFPAFILFMEKFQIYLLSLFPLIQCWIYLYCQRNLMIMGKFRLTKVSYWGSSRIQHFFQLFMVYSEFGQIRN